ncbi:MAG: hypothetical protein RJQ01_03615 [Microcella sp.]
MPRRHNADDLARLDTVALAHTRLHGLDRHEQRAGPDRHQRPIDDDPGEVHDPARRREHGGSVRGRGNVDAAMAGGVGGRGSEEGAQDDARPIHRPHPRLVGEVRVAEVRAAEGRGAAGPQTPHDQEHGGGGRERRAHGASMARGRASGHHQPPPVDDPTAAHAVGER